MATSWSVARLNQLLPKKIDPGIDLDWMLSVRTRLVSPISERALNFSPNVFFWEQFGRLLQSTMHFKKALIKEIVGGGANKNRAFQRGDDYILTHN